MSNFDPLAERWELMQRQPEIVLPEQLGLRADNPALIAIQDFSLRVHEPRALEHPLRVAKILYDFAGDMLPTETLEAALLHDIVERYENTDSLQRPNAKIVLQEYFDDKNTDNDKKIFVSSLLGDMKTVEDAAETYRTAYDEDPRLAEILSGKPTSEIIRPQHWFAQSKTVDVEKMQILLEAVNLESVLIKAAELLDNIIHTPPKDRSLIQDVFEAESFYAPLCEILGFDGLSMALRDAAAHNRFNKSGNNFVLNQAVELVNTVEAEGSIDAVIVKLFGDDALNEPVLGRLSEHAVRVDEVIASAGGIELAGVARVKSVGSLALKLARGAGEPPMDIIGITFIAEDVKMASRFFHALLARIEELPDVDPVPAPSRDEAIHIRGDSDFVTEFLKDASPDAKIDIKVQPAGAFQVAKVTLKMHHKVPVEIQVQTKEDRKNAREGYAAHIRHKDGGREHAIAALGSIHERKKKLQKDRLDVNGQSIHRGMTLLNKLGIIQ